MTPLGKTPSGPDEFGTSYFGVRDPEHVRKDLDRFAADGLTGILHTFSERDRRYYQRTMAEVIAASQERGFRVYVNPWGVGRVFGGEAFSEFTSRHPDACQQLSSGRPAPAACLNAPEFRDFITEWIEDASATGADYLFWDEPHWYTPEWRDEDYPDDAWTCRCRHCKADYKATYGEPMPDELTERIRHFRNESMLDFLETVTERTSEREMSNAICLKPDNGGGTALDWDRVAGLDELDMLATTPFWALHDREPEPFVRKWGGRVVDLSRDHSLESQVWIQGFLHDGGTESAQQVTTAVRTARCLDPDSIFLWGWDGCRVMSSIACEDSHRIWDTFLQTVKDPED